MFTHLLKQQMVYCDYCSPYGHMNLKIMTDICCVNKTMNYMTCAVCFISIEREKVYAFVWFMWSS